MLEFEAKVGLDVLLKRLIDEEYTRHPFYGGYKMVVCVKHCGHRVNRKLAQRLMPSMGLAATVPGSTRDGHTSSKRCSVFAVRLGGGAVSQELYYLACFFSTW